LKILEFTERLAESVRKHVSETVAPLLKRLEKLEARPIPVAENGERGEKGDKGDSGAKGDQGEQGEKGERGEKGEQGIRGADGKDGRNGVDGIDGKAGDQGASGRDGKDGADGRAGIDGKDGALGLRGEKGDAGRDGRDGKDGRDGERGKDSLELSPIPSIDEKKSYPRGSWALHRGGMWHAIRDTDGMDGWACALVGIADAGQKMLDERRMFSWLELSNGKRSELEIKLEHPVYRDVYRSDVEYQKGDMVTYGGSVWVAQVDKPTDKPGISEQWKLAVKRGRDGKDKQ